MALFRSRVARLRHGPKRTLGTGPLLRAARHAVSRRRLRAFIRGLRRRHLRRLRDSKLRVTWRLPNLAWAVDAFLLRTSPADPGLVVVLARDLASHFHFEPLLLPAESAAANLRWLQRLCAKHGPPLLLKRDNGSPFNAAAIDAFLARNLVLPLNSPVRRPSYNGAAEHGVGSCKRAILGALDPDLPVPEPRRLLPLLRAVILHHNARPRRSLGGLSPLQIYFRQHRRAWSRRQRADIFGWISAHAQVTLEAKRESPDQHDRAAAWRSAVVAWLRCRQLISVSPNTQPSPHS